MKRFDRKSRPQFWPGLHHLPVFLGWLVLLLRFSENRALSPNYFAGTIVTNKDCSDEQLALCKKVCPEDQFARCSGYKKSVSGCYCHVAPETVEGISCSKTSTVEPGDKTKSGQKDLPNYCADKIKKNYRSRIDVFVCESSASFCFVQDFLDSIQTVSTFGGKMQEIAVPKDFEDFCRAFCPDTFADFGTFPAKTGYACYCHTDPPPDALGFTCTKMETVTPSDGASGGSTLEDQCRDLGIGYLEDIDLYFCTNPKSPLPLCVLLDQLPEPTTTTTTTTNAPTTTTDAPTTTTTTTTEVSSIDGSFGVGVGAGSSITCRFCQGGFFLSFIVCPILCLIFHVIRFVVNLLSKTLFQTINRLLTFVASTVDDVVGSIGGLLD